MFAGGDYTRALALGSLDDKDIERGKDVSDFNIKQQQELMNRIQFYLEKYVAVGLMQGSKHASELKTGTQNSGRLVVKYILISFKVHF